MGFKDDDEMRDTKFSKSSGPTISPRKQQSSTKLLADDAKKDASFVGPTDLERL